MKTVTGAITLSSLILLSFSSIGATQTATGTNNTPEEESIADSVPDRRRGGASRSIMTLENREDEVEDSEEIVEAPRRRKPAASRNDNQCNFNPQELVALIPERRPGKTIATSPTLYFSVPAIPTHTDVEFVLRDSQDRLVEKQIFSGQGQAGIMALNLPRVSPVSAANTNESYHWYLSIICNQSDRADDVVVEGLLQPVAVNPTLTQQLETATLEEKLALYQAYSLWHERLHTLATMRQSQPQNAQASQQLGQLLQSVKLDPALGQQPVLNTQRLNF